MTVPSSSGITFSFFWKNHETESRFAVASGGKVISNGFSVYTNPFRGYVEFYTRGNNHRWKTNIKVPGFFISSTSNGIFLQQSFPLKLLSYLFPPSISETYMRKCRLNWAQCYTLQVINIPCVWPEGDMSPWSQHPLWRVSKIFRGGSTLSNKWVHIQ